MNNIFMIMIVAILILGLGIVVALILLNKGKKRGNKPSSLPAARPKPKLAKRGVDTGLDDLLPPISQPTNNVPAQQPVQQPLQQSTPAVERLAPTQQRVPAQSVQPLDKADALIEQQQYNEAANELKRILMANPKDSAAMLKLLQVYGITNNLKAFNALHAQIHNFGDSEAIKEADFRRALLEDDLQSASVQPAAPQVAPAIPEVAPAPQLTPAPEINLDSAPSVDLNEFSLDFDAPSAPEAPKAPLQNTVSTEEFSLDFDVAEPVSQNSAPATALKSDVSLDDFDLSFDSAAKAPVVEQTPNSAPQAQETHEFSLDFEVDSPAPVEAPKSTSNKVDDFGLSFELEEPAPVSVSAPVSTPAQETSFDDLTFDALETSSAQSESPVLAPEPVSAPTPSTDDGFDFDFGTDLMGTPTQVESAPVQAEPTNTELSNDFDSFDTSFDLENFETLSSTASTSALAPEPEAIKTSDDEFSFDDLLSTPVTQDPVASNTETSFTPELTNEFGGDFDNEFKSIDDNLIDTPVTTPEITTETAFADDFGLDLDLGDTAPQEVSISKPVITITPAAVETPKSDLEFDLDVNIGQPTPVVSEPVVAQQPQINATITTTPVAEDLNFVANLDNAEITLNLANKYLGLGEQDSAKRLLEEVVSIGNPNQQQVAKNLLARLG